jgi:hypothetical protein
MTVSPACTHTWAMPAPIVPRPATPTVSIRDVIGLEPTGAIRG